MKSQTDIDKEMCGEELKVYAGKPPAAPVPSSDAVKTEFLAILRDYIEEAKRQHTKAVLTHDVKINSSASTS